jgi:hypothetical protein
MSISSKVSGARNGRPFCPLHARRSPWSGLIRDKIIRTRLVDAIRVLAALLDSHGVVGRAAVEGLVTFGYAAVPEMQRVLRESLDLGSSTHATEVICRVRRACVTRLAA